MAQPSLTGGWREPHIPVGRDPDGGWLYAPMGAMCDVDGDEVVCHACGAFKAWLTRAHLRHHDLTPGEYRRKYHLPQAASLYATNVLAQRSGQVVRRYSTRDDLNARLAEQRTITSEIAARRRQQRAEDLGYQDPQAYMLARRAAGWGINRIAQESRTSPRWIRRASAGCTPAEAR